MLYCITKQGQRVSPLQNDSDQLKRMSHTGELTCPECGAELLYRHGERKRPHFAHKNAECTYPYWEPESDEHIQGKLLLQKRLQALFPSSRVELEHRLEATNQRSDVIVIHPSGEKWAFEFQCSKIPGHIWWERHDLYQRTGVKDFWVLGGSVHSYGHSNREPDSSKHRICDLERALNAAGPLHYLDVDAERMRILEGEVSGQLLFCDEYMTPFENAYLRDDRWWTDELEEQRLKQEATVALQRQLEQDRETERKKQGELELQWRQGIYRELYQQRSRFTAGMSATEKSLFLKLCRKHGYDSDSFPGVLHVEVVDEPYKSIQTPEQLWQLWLYDRFIFKKSKQKHDKIWLPRVKEDFWSGVRRGDFRLMPGTSTKESWSHFSTELYRYIDRMEEIGMVARLGRDYYQVIRGVLPRYQNRKENILHKMAMEGVIGDLPIPQAAYQKLLSDIKKENQ